MESSAVVFFYSELIMMVAFICCEVVPLGPNEELRNIGDEFLEWKLQQFPEKATENDFHQYDHLLESYSVIAWRERKDRCDQFLQAVLSINTTSLSQKDLTNRDILIDQLSTYIDGYQWTNYINPINFLEIHSIYQGQWITKAGYKTEEDFHKYFRRLEAIPQRIEDVILQAERNIDKGTTNHLVSLEKVPSMISEIAYAEPEKTVYYRPIQYDLASLEMSDAKRNHLKAIALRIIEHSVQKALKRLQNYVNHRLIAKAREHIGVLSLPNGTAYYKSLLRWHLSEDIDPVTVHQVGMKEVHRIRGQMEKIMKKLGFSANLPLFFYHLRNQRRFYNHTEDQLLEKYRNTLYMRVNPTLHNIFHEKDLSNIPKARVRKMRADGVVAQYWDNTLEANTRRPETRASFTIMGIVLHEANPGHHLQISIENSLSLPEFRKQIWPGRKYTAPFQFPPYTACIEGWGLYAEFLGEELGLFEDPYENFGRYILEIWRACRLVMDTGIHMFGWSRQEAIEYMANNTYLPLADIEKEVDRYITWPGQACAYKIGELKIKKLRDLAQKVLGSKYDVRDFHSQILKLGFVPLEIMESSIKNWIYGPSSNALKISQGAQHFNCHICIYFCLLLIGILNKQ